MSRKFQIVIADPAWAFSDKLEMSNVPRGAAANYNTLSNQDIINLNIKEIVDPNGCLLALWVPSSLLQTGLEVMSAWGFTHKQTYIWVKTKKEPFSWFSKLVKKHFTKFPFKKTSDNNKTFIYLSQVFKDAFLKYDLNEVLSFGMGRLFRQTHEICLIGINNNKIYKNLKNKSQRSVCFSENLKHSRKPDDLHKSLEIMFPDADSKLELFARREYPGWICIGNEIPGMIGEDIRVSLKKLI